MGAFLRDFAMAGNCGENPMNSFLNNVDKSSSQLDLWQRDFQNFEKHEQTPISHLPLGFQDGFQEHPTFEDYGDFEDVWDNSLRFNIPRDEFAEFEVNPLVHNILHDFLNFSASNKIMPPQSFPQNEVQLSNVEVNKIVERSGAIARHFCVNNQNYQLMSQQLGNLFRSLNIHVDPRVILQKYTQPIGDWEREFIHFNEPQYHDSSFDRQFDSVWENQRQRIQQANEWRDDYQKNWSNYRAPEITTEEEKIFENAFQSSSSAWVNEYNQDEDQERAEEEAWFSKFIDPQRSSNNNNNWVNDYHGKSNSGIPWVDEFHNNVNDEFNNLTEKVSEIPFEKLQNSNFMKFVNQVKNKEVTLPDLQMKVMED